MLFIDGIGFGRSNRTLDWVRYTAAQSLLDCNRTNDGSCDLPPPKSGCGSSNSSASCKLFLARDCAILEPYTRVRCILHPESWGVNYAVQISAGGQSSGWKSEGEPMPPRLHGAPQLTSLRVEFPAEATRELWRGYALTSGGSTVTIMGTGLSANIDKELIVTVGGVLIHDAVRIALFENGTGYLTFRAPPGYGDVNVSVSVGDRSSNNLTLSHQPMRLTKETVKAVRLKGSSYVPSSNKSFLLLGEGFASCALIHCVPLNYTEICGQEPVCALPSIPACNISFLGDSTAVSWWPFYCLNGSRPNLPGDVCHQEISPPPLYDVTPLMGSRDSGVCVRTNATKGILNLCINSINATFDYDFESLETLPPQILAADDTEGELEWSPNGGNFSFYAERAGSMAGSVHITWEGRDSNVTFVCNNIIGITLLPDADCVKESSTPSPSASPSSMSSETPSPGNTSAL